MSRKPRRRAPVEKRAAGYRPSQERRVLDFHVTTLEVFADLDEHGNVLAWQVVPEGWSSLTGFSLRDLLKEVAGSIER